MGKRFTDTEKWTKNKWFRKLPVNYKLLWLFILDNCDCVGVWEEDTEFVADILDIQLQQKEALALFERQIMVISSGKKWWITNFCFYQYGELKEENIKNKPHQKYISELKKHRLWIDYTKTIHSLKEKEEDKEKEKDTEEEKEFTENLESGTMLIPQMLVVFCDINKTYHKEQNRDFPELLKIAQTLAENKKPTVEIIPKWKSVVEFIVADNFYKSYSLKQINTHIQSILLKKENNGNNTGSYSQGITGNKNLIGQGGFGKL